MLRARDLLADQRVHRSPGAPAAPLVSVVLAVEGRAGGAPLRRAVASVLAQDFADLELIVVEEGLVEGVADELLAAAGEDPRVVRVRHELASDLPALRLNEGIELARGRWVAFQLDDGEWLPGGLRAFVEAASALASEGPVFGLAETSSGDEPRGRLPDVPVNLPTLSYADRIARNAVLLPRALLVEGGLFDPHVAMRGSSDWDLWLRLARRVPFVAVERVVSRVRVGRLPAADPTLFRFLQWIPRDHPLCAERWRDVVVDSSAVVAGVALPAAMAERLDRDHAAPFRARLRGAVTRPAGGDDAPATPAAGQGGLLLASDAYYDAIDLCLGHYDLPSVRRGGPKMFYVPTDQLRGPWHRDAQAMLLLRTVTPPPRHLALEAIEEGVPVAYYIDDDLLHLHEYGPPFEAYAPDGERGSELRRQLAVADAVWSTGHFLDEAVRPWNPRLVPHMSAVPERALPDRLRPRGASGRVRIGYVGGGYRLDEFRLLWDGLERFARERAGEVEFLFWGVDVSGLPPLAAPVVHRPFTHSFRAFLDALPAAACDVLLTPLLGHPRPRQAKAPSKYFLTAVAGALGIFSDVAPYQSLPAPLTCLRAANGPGAWRDALEEAMAMPAERFDAMRRAMVEHVRLERTEHAQIHLHEAAWRATLLHGATRGQRVEGRPRALFVFPAGATPAERDQLLRDAALAERYGFAARALCAGNDIELHRRLAQAGVPFGALAAALLRGDAASVEREPLRVALRAEAPARVQCPVQLPALAAACADLGVPLAVAGRGRRSVAAAAFDLGSLRVLEPLAGATPRPAATIVVIGDLEPARRQLLAIDAFGALTRAGAPDNARWRLRLLGSTVPDPAYANRCLRRIHELGLAGRVEVLRVVRPVHEQLADAGLVLELGTGDVMPDELAEALAAGSLVLASSPGAFDGALREGETALRQRGETAEAVAAAVDGALRLPPARREAIVAAAYRWARAELHPERAGDELMSLWLAATAPPPPRERDGGPEAVSTAADVRDGAPRRRRPRWADVRWPWRRKPVLVLHEAASVSLDICYRSVLGELESASGRRWLVRHVDDAREEELRGFTAVVLARTVSRRSLDLMRAARRAGCRTLYDADDHLLLLEQVIPDAENPWRRHFDRARPEIEALLREADVVKLYHPHAAPYFRELNPRLVWLRAPHTAFAGPRDEGSEGPPVKVGLLGSAYKDEELRPAVAAIRRLLDEGPAAGPPLRFEMFGIPPESLRDDPRISVVPWQAGYGAYRETLARLEWDVALAPLRDLPFNRCKTDAKYREYGSAGIAGIYADMPVYRDAVRHRETGLLVAHEEEGAWRDAILELARDAPLRRSIRTAAAADVRASYRPDRYAAGVAALLEGPLPAAQPPAPGR